MQYAESMFLNHEHFATSKRNGILMMVSLFERQVVILPDRGLRGRLESTVTDQVIAVMKSPLRQHRIKAALEAGLMELVGTLSVNESASPSVNELSDNIIEEEGV